MLHHKKPEPVKTLTLQEYIDYRNKLVTRRDARARHFPEKVTYYTARLEILDRQYPEFRGIGHIQLKK